MKIIIKCVKIRSFYIKIWNFPMKTKTFRVKINSVRENQNFMVF